MGNSANNLDKTLTKPPKAGANSPRLKIVKVLKTWAFVDLTRPGLLAADIDDNYAYIKTASEYEAKLKKPSWLTDPKSEMAVWFAQECANSVILYRDVAYLLLRVSQGPVYQKQCVNSYCIEARKTQAKLSTGLCPNYHRRGHHRRWVLKPIVLPAESEEYVLEQLRIVL
jgi:hypothetical protein